MKLIINGFILNKSWLVIGLFLLGKECAAVKLSKTSIKTICFALDSWFCTVHFFEMCVFKKNLDNVLPVNEAFQNSCLHTQGIDDIYLVLEEVLSLTLLRPGFYPVSLHFALGWGSRVETSHKDAAPVKATFCSLWETPVPVQAQKHQSVIYTIP